MKEQKQNYIKAVLGLLSMVFLIYIGSVLLKSARLDFTQEGLFTLSDGTKSILQKLDAPIKLKLYYSKTAANRGTEGLRTFNNHFLYVEELLKRFQSNSRNNVSLQVIDPRPDTPQEEDAVAYGLKKFNLTQTESYFFGLVAENESGSEKVIEFFDPQQKDRVEYDVIKLIFTVLNPQKKTIGILSPLKVLADDVSGYMAQLMAMQGKQAQQSWLVTKFIKEFYKVKQIDPTAGSITGVDTLVVIHPKGFSEKTLFAIDQYLLGGGNLLVMVDPAAVSDQQGAMMGQLSNSPDAGFKKLMDQWGIELKAGKFAGDKNLAAVGQMNPTMPASRLLMVMNCDSRCSSEYKDPVTSGLNQATFLAPGVLSFKESEGIKGEVILATTDKGNGYSASGFELNNPPALLRNFKEGVSPVPMAYKLIGKFKTAFPGGKPKEEKRPDEKGKTKQKTTPEAPTLKESQKESAIIVFSDVDFLADRFAFRQSFLGVAPANDNSTLFQNAIETLSGDLELLSVRSKGRINRSFTTIDEIEFEAEKKTENKVKEINGSIARFQQELQQLGRNANEGNIALLQNQGLKKQKELNKKIAVLRKELRAVKREGRERIESLGRTYQYINTLFMPFLVIVGGVLYSRRRKNKMKLKRNQSPSNPKTNSNLKEATV